MGDLVRLFFGFELPRDVIRISRELRTLVGDPKKTVRWVPTHNIHLTLRYLGPTPDSAVAGIVSAAESGLADMRTMQITLAGTGVFPAPTRPRVLWLGVDGDIETVQQMEGAIHGLVEPLGFPKEPRDYVPHVTLGRVRYPQKVPPDVSMFLQAEYQPVDCSLEVLNLYESRVGERGVSYVPLASFQLNSTDQERS